MGAPKAQHILGFTQQSAIRWFAPAKRLSSAVLLPAVVSGNPIGRARGRCDEVEMPEATMDGRTDGRMDGWMDGCIGMKCCRRRREMGYRDAYLHVNGESGLEGSE